MEWKTRSFPDRSKEIWFDEEKAVPGAAFFWYIKAAFRDVWLIRAQSFFPLYCPMNNSGAFFGFVIQLSHADQKGTGEGASSLAASRILSGIYGASRSEGEA